MKIRIVTETTGLHPYAVIYASGDAFAKRAELKQAGLSWGVTTGGTYGAEIESDGRMIPTDRFAWSGFTKNIEAAKIKFSALAEKIGCSFDVSEGSGKIQFCSKSEKQTGMMICRPSGVIA